MTMQAHATMRSAELLLWDWDKGQVRAEIGQCFESYLNKGFLLGDVPVLPYRWLYVRTALK